MKGNPNKSWLAFTGLLQNGARLMRECIYQWQPLTMGTSSCTLCKRWEICVNRWTQFSYSEQLQSYHERGKHFIFSTSFPYVWCHNGFTRSCNALEKGFITATFIFLYFMASAFMERLFGLRGGFTCLSTCGPVLLLNLPISYGWGTLRSCRRRWWWQGYRQKRLLAQGGWTKQREDIPTLLSQNKSTGPNWYTEKRQIPVGSIPFSLLGNDVARQRFPGEQMAIQLYA